MSLVLISGKQIICILVVMIAGFIAAKAGMLDRDTNKKLSDVLLNIVNPVVMLLSYQRAYEVRLANNLMVTFFITFGILFLSGAAAYLLFRGKKDENGLLDPRTRVERFGAMYSNAGFLGIPLVNGVFGSEGVFYVTAFVTAFNIVVWTHGVICMSGRFSREALRRGLLSPSLIAIILGVVCFFAGIELPEIVTLPLGYIYQLNTGLAMLVAGSSLAFCDLSALRSSKRVFFVCAAKLILFPALTGLLLRALPIDPIVRGVALIASACPSAAMTFMFAYRYGGDDRYASLIFALTTICCAATIPLIMFLA